MSTDGRIIVLTKKFKPQMEARSVFGLREMIISAFVPSREVDKGRVGGVGAKMGYDRCQKFSKVFLASFAGVK